MSRFLGRTIMLVTFALLALAAGVATLPPRADAGPSGRWTTIATTTGTSNHVEMLRTRDGQLHLVWLEKGGGVRLSVADRRCVAVRAAGYVSHPAGRLDEPGG